MRKEYEDRSPIVKCMSCKFIVECTTDNGSTVYKCDIELPPYFPDFNRELETYSMDRNGCHLGKDAHR